VGRSSVEDREHIGPRFGTPSHEGVVRAPIALTLLEFDSAPEEAGSDPTYPAAAQTLDFRLGGLLTQVDSYEASGGRRGRNLREERKPG